MGLLILIKYNKSLTHVGVIALKISPSFCDSISLENTVNGKTME
jgi:hypothetical protein